MLATQACLEQLPQRLDQRELKVLWQAANVVVALYRVAVLLPTARRRARLNHVWVQRALHQVPAHDNPVVNIVERATTSTSLCAVPGRGDVCDGNVEDERMLNTCSHSGLP